LTAPQSTLDVDICGRIFAVPRRETFEQNFLLALRRASSFDYSQSECCAAACPMRYYAIGERHFYCEPQVALDGKFGGGMTDAGHFLDLKAIELHRHASERTKSRPPAQIKDSLYRRINPEAAAIAASPAMPSACKTFTAWEASASQTCSVSIGSSTGGEKTAPSQ
jgi:hypothetical protein